MNHSSSTETQPPPPPLPPKPDSLRATLAVLLSLYLALFLADAGISLIDDSLGWLLRMQPLQMVRSPLAALVLVLSLGVYLLIGLTPLVPKRLFLPLVAFTPVAFLVAVPVIIYHYDQLPLIAWVGSLAQVVVGLAVVYCTQRRFRPCWPWLREEHLAASRFRWGNLLGFLGLNVCVLLPGTILYLLVSASLAIDHYSDGFVRLHARGLTVQTRKYTRADGRTIWLYPMAHIADRSFYETLAASFTTNSVALMEGVSDDHGLLTNHISYRRAAQTLGVAEQHENFKPTRGELIPADVDVSEFSTNTIGFLNLTMLVHTQGLQPGVLLRWLQFKPAPGFEQELLTDLLSKRNQHVVAELRSRLADAREFILPWGAAHMPGIAREIEKLGFKLSETRDFTVVRFGRPADPAPPAASSR